MQQWGAFPRILKERYKIAYTYKDQRRDMPNHTNDFWKLHRNSMKSFIIVNK